MGVDAGQKAVREFPAKFSKEFPGLCKCLTEDLDALLAHLQLPWRLRKFTRTTNLIERSFAEERRRTKTLPRFFSEKSCLKLVYAVLIRAAARWQAISKFAHHKYVDIYNISLSGAGGITNALHMAQVADSAGLSVLVGPTQELSIGVAAQATIVSRKI